MFECNPNEEEVSKKFDEDGFVCISALFPGRVVQELLGSYERSFQECFRALHKSGRIPFPHSHLVEEGGGDVSYPLGVGVKHGYREIVMRSPGRYEVTYGLSASKKPFDGAVADAKVEHIVRALFKGCDYYLSSLSVVTATPGCPQQAWHADGGHVDLSQHQPCHCLNVFLPLVDLTPQLGPTQVRPGTHHHTRNLAPMMLAAKARKTLRPPLTPILNAGDALVFDYRVLHRGLPNVTANSRPILVMAFAKKWFTDILNFPRRSMLHAHHDQSSDQSTEE
eukprot:CAMPEP_0185726698 /NCGR_PEP_ID=MMETSP1171-20130828/2590_1 /TAXON_ID=374046 /ORGANISM="Helicotheca tamensis, Strain CCMP826" /LENGTH=279 /DNA_ID=CAMNT_0028395093 /DNA_START=38 /DNA_END=877 /DNA_ORIENTATION=-